MAIIIIQIIRTQEITSVGEDLEKLELVSLLVEM